MRRVLGVLLLAAPAAIAAAASGAPNRIPLVIPPAQSVAIEAVKLTGRVSVRTLRLVAGDAAPGATAMVAVKTGPTGVTIFAVVVNRSGGKTSLGLAGVPVGAHVASKSLADVGGASTSARSAFSRNIRRFLGWNPLASPNVLAAPGVVLRLYDAKHRAGRPLQAAQAVQAVQATTQLLAAPNISVRDEVYKQIDQTSACILGRIRCGDYLFSFSGGSETIVRSDTGFKLTTKYSGRTCGRTALGQPWQITTQSGTAAPVTRTVDFARDNVVFTTVAESPTGENLGDAKHKLVVYEGAFPTMEILVDSTVVWSSNAGGAHVPISVKKLPAGKSC